MARRVYFAFDYKDVFEVNQIRRSGEFVGVASPDSLMPPNGRN